MVTRQLTSALPIEVFHGVSELAHDDWRLPPGPDLYYHPTDNMTVGRGGSKIRCVVWHITEGSAASAIAWFHNSESQASSNDVIDRDGVITNVVEGKDTPWTNGRVCKPNLEKVVIRQTVEAGINPNKVSYTIECAGFSGKGISGSLTDAQTVALIGRTAQACTEYKLSADAAHIFRHSDWDDCDRHNCPGFSPGEMVSWIEAVSWLCYRWRGW